MTLARLTRAVSGRLARLKKRHSGKVASTCPTFECLEQRLLLSSDSFGSHDELVDHFTNSGFNHPVERIVYGSDVYKSTTVEADDRFKRYKVYLQYGVGPGWGDPNSANVYVNGRVYKVAAGAPVDTEFVSADDFNISVAFDNSQDLDDRVIIDWAAESLGYINPDAPVLHDDGSVEFGTSGSTNTHVRLTGTVKVQLWFSKDAKGTQKVGGGPVSEYILRANSPNRTESVPLSRMQAYGKPAGANYLVTVITNIDNLVESQAGDEYASVMLPNLRTLEPSVSSTPGNHVVIVPWEHNTATLPYQLDPFMSLWWSKGPQWRDRISSFSKVWKLNPGDPTRTETVEFEVQDRPEGATHLIAAADPNGLLPERDENDNIKSIALPNIYIADKQLSYNNDRGADDLIVTMGAKGPMVPSSSRIQVQAYLKNGQWAETISELLVPLPGTTESIRFELPKGIEPNHVYIKVDVQDAVLESDENDNEGRASSTKVFVRKIAYDGRGGLRVKLRQSGAPIPKGEQVPLRVLWEFKDGSRQVAVRRFLVDPFKTKDIVRIRANELGRPPKLEYYKGPVVAIRIAVDPAGKVVRPESVDSPELASLDVPKVSYELGDAPVARKAADRVRLWLQDNRRTIITSADLYEIHPGAVAGAIAWEALFNIQDVDTLSSLGGSAWRAVTGYWPTERGPGKIHYIRNSSALGTIDAGVASEVEKYWPESSSKDLQNHTAATRQPITNSTNGAIRYIAAIMGAYADIIDRQNADWGDTVRDSPGILGNLYNGAADAADLDEWREKVQDPAYAGPSFAGEFGTWIDKNTTKGGQNKRIYIDSTLMAPRKLKKNANRWPQPRTVTIAVSPGQSTRLNPLDLVGAQPGELRIGSIFRAGNLDIIQNGDELQVNIPEDYTTPVEFDLNLVDDEDVLATVSYRLIPASQLQLSAVDVRARQVDLGWNDSLDIETGYRIRMSDDGGKTWVTAADTTPDATGWTITGLEPGQEYTFKIRALFESGSSDFSNEVTITTEQASPGSITGLAVVDTRRRQVDLRWDPAENAKWYRIATSSDNGNSWALKFSKLQATEITVNELLPNTAWMLRVRAENASGIGPWEIVQTVTQSAVPVGPTDLGAYEIKRKQIDLHWVDNSDNEDHFRISMSTDGGTNWDSIGNAPSSDAASADYRVTGLEPDTTYWFRVRAVNETPEGDTILSPYSNIFEVTTQPAVSAPPTVLIATEIRRRQIDLSWVDNSIDEEEFRIALSTDGGANWDNEAVIPGNGDITGTITYTVSGLLPDTDYWFKVRAANSFGRSAYTNIIAVRTPTAVPEAPSDLGAYDVRKKQIDLHWMDNSDNEDQFRISMSSDGGANWDSIANISGSDESSAGYTVTELSPGTTYLFRVRAVNDTPEGTTLLSTYSNIFEVTTAPPVSAPPNGLVATDVRRRQVDLTWFDASIDEDDFRVAVSTNGGASWNSFDVVTSTNISGTGQVFYTATDLLPDKDYQFKVRASNTFGYSAYTDPVTIRTLSAVPEAPSDLGPYDVRKFQVDLHWVDNSDNEDQFRISMSSDSGANWDSIANIPGSDAGSMGYTVTGLEPDTTYLFRVRAVNDTPEGTTLLSPYSNVLTVKTLSALPQAPTGLVATDVRRRQVDLHWNDNATDETEYLISISVNGGPWNSFATLSANQTTYTASNLNPDTDYAFRVRAGNNYGRSAYSNVLYVRTDTAVPADPSNLRATDVRKRQVDLAWDDNSDNEDNFRLAMSTNGGASWNNIAVLAANTTSYTVTELNPDTDYQFKLRASNDPGTGILYSNYTNIVSIRTDLAPPSAPTLISLVDGKPDAKRNPRFEWSTVAGATYYVLQLYVDTPNNAVGNRRYVFTATSDPAMVFRIPSDDLLRSGRTYYWDVVAGNDAGESSPSAKWSFTTV